MAKLSKAKQAEQAAEKEKAREYLRGLLPPGAKVYGQVMHVSRDGMSRVIRLHVPHLDKRTGELSILDITGRAATAIGWPVTDRPCWGMRVGGCGMDMVFHAVHTLSYALHGTGGEHDDRAQIAARNGPMAPGATSEQFRRPGYTLRSER